MKKYDIYCSLFGLILAVSIISGSLRLGLGTFGYPGPGFFPILVASLLVFISGAIILMALKNRHQEHHFREWPSFYPKVPITLIVLLGYASILEYLGYPIASFLLLLYLFKVTGSRKWWTSLVMAATVVALTYYIFGVLLQAQFPKGVFGIG